MLSQWVLRILSNHWDQGKRSYNILWKLVTWYIWKAERGGNCNVAVWTCHWAFHRESGDSSEKELSAIYPRRVSDESVQFISHAGSPLFLSLTPSHAQCALWAPRPMELVVSALRARSTLGSYDKTVVVLWESWGNILFFSLLKLWFLKLYLRNLSHFLLNHGF